jgi:hypothetical protein
MLEQPLEIVWAGTRLGMTLKAEGGPVGPFDALQ